MKKTTGDLANLLTRPISELDNSRPTFNNFNLQNNKTKKGKGFTILGSVLATAAIVAATTFLVLQNSNIDHILLTMFLKSRRWPNKQSLQYHKLCT